jgi:TonB family protein
MTELDGSRYRLMVTVLAGAVSALTMTGAHASKYNVELETIGVSPTTLEQAPPAFPNGKMRAGQEGWVRMNFVVGPQGRALDPVIVDSSGGPLFERAALDAVSSWQFKSPAAGMVHANNTVEVRFESGGDSGRAGRDFLRRSRDIVSDLYYGKARKAREKVDMANEFGGWNLYESTMLALLNARVEAAESDAPEELEYYRRALAISGPTTLKRRNRLEILARIFELEVDSRQYGEALVTLQTLRAINGSDAALADVDGKIRQLESSIDGGEPLAVAARIDSPCDCDEGRPLWAYTPARRDFSFAEVSGNVEGFEARCDNHRLSAQVATGTRWSLPADWGSCRIFVFGDDAATFEFIEYHEDPGGEDIGGSAVASSDVVD